MPRSLTPKAVSLRGSPVVSKPALARLTALNERMRDLAVVVDNVANVEALAAAVTRPLHVLIDIDPGIRRTGVPSAAAAVQVLKAIQQQKNLSYRGVQMYCGIPSSRSYDRMAGRPKSSRVPALARTISTSGWEC